MLRCANSNTKLGLPMLNLTNGQLVFRKSGAELHQDVRESLEAVARGLLKLLDLESLDLGVVTTKTHPEAAFPKFVLRNILRAENTFNEAYLEGLWRYYQSRSEDVTPEMFYAVTLSEGNPELPFRLVFVKGLKRGMGLFLIALHCRGAITLPMRFDWPPGLVKAGIWSRDLGLFSELLSFLRLLEATTDDLPHPAFSSVGTTQKRREWFLCYGTKLLLATGWQRPQDARLLDLIKIKQADADLGIPAEVIAFKALIDVLRARFGTGFDITVDDWASELARSVTPHLLTRRGTLSAAENTGGKKLKKLGLAISLDVDDEHLVSEVIKATPQLATPEALKTRPRLPGLTTELLTFAELWLELEDVYKKTVKRESYKTTDAALGYLNIYLFFYLPYWFQRRPNTKLKYPIEPRMLLASIFISRLMKVGEDDVPLTFVEYLELTAEARQWTPPTHYANLKQVEIFFSFLELHGDDLRGCLGFRQPIPNYAYPALTRNTGTNKRPVPRRLFGVFLDYIEALRAHLAVVLEKTLSGELDGAELSRRVGQTSTTIIDTFATGSLVGFVPVLFTKDKTIPLRYIPDCLSLDWFPVEGGRRLKLPQPHALNQIIVALYTGLRHNHIQWLDASTFDSKVTPEDHDFTFLFVNTDKSMRKPWAPHVNFRVIEVLRDQLAWRNVIEHPGFSDKQHYNGNANTKWPPILPLFARDPTGRPHHDSRYESVWSDLVSAVDALLPTLGIAGLKQLSALEPPGVDMNDPAARSKRQAYGDGCTTVCELKVKSRITPHSSRVSVVSQYATLLPADFIGTHITGQKTGTVYHYVVIDPEDLHAAQAHQAMRLREQGYRGTHETWSAVGAASKRHIRADDVNSAFSQSLRENLQETLVSYGCISITMNEDATSGLDVLRETRAVNAAENKTEICPYGNHCPPEVVKQWRGLRRCGLCQYAVRSVDHLPAVSAKVKEFDEMLHDLTVKVEAATDTVPPRYTDEELDRLDDERARLAEELTGWRLSEEVLDAARIRIANGQDDRRWVVQKPEIIQQDLQRVAAPNNLTAYLLLRLEECLAYPSTESPQIRARFDMLRRSVLARTGQMAKAFDPAIPVDPAKECAGLLRTVVEANNLTYDDVIKLLDGDGHLQGLPTMPKQLLLEGES